MACPQHEAHGPTNGGTDHAQVKERPNGMVVHELQKRHRASPCAASSSRAASTTDAIVGWSVRSTLRLAQPFSQMRCCRVRRRACTVRGNLTVKGLSGMLDFAAAVIRMTKYPNSW